MDARQQQGQGQDHGLHLPWQDDLKSAVCSQALLPAFLPGLDRNTGRPTANLEVISQNYQKKASSWFVKLKDYTSIVPKQHMYSFLCKL